MLSQAYDRLALATRIARAGARGFADVMPTALSPPVQRGLKQLDRSAFDVSVPLLGASVAAARCKHLLTAVEGCGDPPALA